MKTKLLLGFATVGLVMSNCSNEEIISDITSANAQLVTASIEGEGVSRSNVTDKGVFTWSAGDVISVYSTSTNEPWIKSSKLAQGGQTTATFAVTYPNGVNAKDYAVYPYNESHSLTNGTLNIHMPSVYDYSSEDTYQENTNAPMIAAIASESRPTSFEFKHVGAVIRFIVENVPAGASQFVFTALNNKVTGDFEVKNDVIATSASTENNSVTIKFKALTANASSMKFFIPVPTGDYQNMKVQVLDDSNNVLAESESNNSIAFTIARRDLKLGPTIVCTAGSFEANEVADESSLRTALEKGGNIKLTEAISLSTALTVSQDVTIDLNGQTLTAAGTAFEVTSGKLAIGGNGKLTSGVDAISIEGSENATVEVTVGENVEIEAIDCCIVVPNSNNSENITITTAGKLSATGDYNTVQFNGNAKGVTLNVTGGTISHIDADAVGIYFPCDGTLNISGGEISAATAVYVKSGNLNITAGTLKGTGTAADYSYNGNGCNPTGDALVIDNCAYPSDIKTISVSGGSFISTNAKAVGSYAGNDVTEVKTGFITGGTFSDASAFEHLGDNANVTLGADMELTKAITITKTAIINLNDFDITAPACDAFEVQTGGSLTINGDADSEVYAGVGGENLTVGSVCAVFANGGDVVINGGYYKVGPDSNSDRNDCIYAKQSSLVTINGGKFEYTGESSDENGKDGDLFLLNCLDKSSAKITVNGGTFKKHAPSYEPVAPSGFTEVVLGENKAVYNNDVIVTNAHAGDSDVWYAVK